MQEMNCPPEVVDGYQRADCPRERSAIEITQEEGVPATYFYEAAHFRLRLDAKRREQGKVSQMGRRWHCRHTPASKLFVLTFKRHRP